MSREILVDQSVHNSLVHGYDEGGEPSIGLLVGTYPEAPQKNTTMTIVFLAQTNNEAPQAQENDEAEDSSPSKASPTITSPSPNLSNLRPPLLSHHTKQLLRMLPGGLTILGLYVIEATDNIFTQKYEQNVKQLLTLLTKQLAKNQFYSAEAEKDKVVFHFNPQSKKFNCRVFETSKFGVKTGFETVFGETEWDKVETNFDTSGVVLQQGDGQGDLKRNLLTVLKKWEEALKSSKVIINGALPSQETIYEEDDETQVSILIDQIPGVLVENKKDFVNHLHIEGMIHAVAFVPKGSSTLFVKEALVADILRSITARMEMHCESLIDEELSNDCKVYHEIPRRVFVRLLKEILVSDYLFPGEGPTDSINSFKEILNLEGLNEGDIDLSRERAFDLDELQGLKGSMEELLCKAESISKLPPGLVMSNTRALAWVFSLAFFVGILAALMPFIQRKFFANDDDDEE